MAGIYVHIPFCKTKCPYCDFFSVTRRGEESTFINALLGEISLQRNYLHQRKIRTLYFGGGTPSLLHLSHLKLIFDRICAAFNVVGDAEITIECNPDDVTPYFFRELRSIGFNRLSLGIQSFHEEELRVLGRRHTVKQNDLSIQQALQEGFKNISIDLIYGLPGSTSKSWKETLEMAFEYPFKHLSAYHLTIEPGTVFGDRLKKGELEEISEENSVAQFRKLIDYSGSKGFEHYELSSFALPGYYSRHNTGYWKQEPYLGLGPSAHSYNGNTRQWNVSHTRFYTDSLLKGQIPCKWEILTKRDHFNEYLMTRLRTHWGVDLAKISRKFGSGYRDYLLKAARPFLNNQYLKRKGNVLTLTNEGKFISDTIFREIFKEEQ
ncbi:MAG: radical SAM family heme chaperone HemW [Bacteroidales bacterium]|nr:radical SAM family heme chaperone HemW [Bacteroidales bacterium]